MVPRHCYQADTVNRTRCKNAHTSETYRHCLLVSRTARGLRWFVAHRHSVLLTSFVVVGVVVAGSAESKRTGERRRYTCEPPTDPLAPKTGRRGLRRRFTVASARRRKGGEKRGRGKARKVRCPSRLLHRLGRPAAWRTSLQSDDEDFEVQEGEGDAAVRRATRGE
ncbi:hypothetical protein MTO96_016483 [Rhipicephalus appendiculatus]